MGVVGKLVLSIFYVLSVIATAVSAQEKTDSLYARGLRACLEKEVASYSRFSDKDRRDVVVLSNTYLTRNLPDQLGAVRVKYLDDYQLSEKFKALPKADREKGIRFQKIFPLSDNDDKLRFAYNTYWFTYSEKRGFFTRKKIIFGHALEGGCHAEIGFDPVQKKLVIEKVTLWGV